MVMVMRTVGISVGRWGTFFVSLMMVMVATGWSARNFQQHGERLLVSMCVVVMMMGVLVTLVPLHAEGCVPTIVVFFVKYILILDSFRFPAIL